MTLDKRTRERLLAHCGQLHEDDGVDPRQFFKPDKKRNKQNHKTRQLCHQVAETLGLVLTGEFGDERLHGLQVASVEPAPDASQLSVTLRTGDPCDAIEAQEILNRLASVKINVAVDVCNAVSLHSGLPISVVDLDVAREPFRVAIAPQGSTYVFNQTGQTIDIAGLLCLFDSDGPCGNAVKDSQRTKTSAATRRTLSLIWSTKSLPGRCEATEQWYLDLLESHGATLEPLYS